MMKLQVHLILEQRLVIVFFSLRDVPNFHKKTHLFTSMLDLDPFKSRPAYQRVMIMGMMGVHIIGYFRQQY